MPTRIATWNVNSLRQRLEHLKAFTDSHQPDVLCLQETKVQDSEFPEDDIKSMGYETVLFHGQKSYNGVAILCRNSISSSNRKVWCDKDDRRHLMVTLPNGIQVHNFYVPSGGPVPDPEQNDKFAHKLSFLEEMIAWAAEPSIRKEKVILVGDLNVAPLETDVWNHKKLLKSVGHTPQESGLMARLKAAGDFTDVGRHFVPPEQPLYSWWGYRYKLSFAKDYGWRLDHILATEALRPHLKHFEVVKDTRSWEKPSDHVPNLVDLDL
ncbi:exodeoxyribonuclease III [Kiloniella laminariae]|uniref:Exodeoxyribonuclease III n=1 Tax=Kiloniella laminariae TaxID=454162 RepID=A0ABT4LMF0_9PROT|nr:exodeoxyribonuclease III [Kiloniella laminariae]MCZ4281142.1 exodeoxyribonuclease III [Kiloniella laminariae]